ncbi:13875_t:CDS:1, partial [Entrophospora sp. SA101]
ETHPVTTETDNTFAHHITHSNNNGNFNIYDSKSINVTSETHPVTTETDNKCDLMSNDQDAIFQ